MNNIFSATNRVLSDHKIAATLTEVTKNGFPRRSPRCTSLSLRLKNTADLDKLLQLSDKLALAANCESVMIFRDRGVVWVDFSLPKEEWQMFTFNEVRDRGIGISTSGNIIDYNLDVLHQKPHTLLAGTSGSGKSSTMRAILGRAFIQGQARNLKVYICDPNSELAMFEDYAEAYSTGGEPLALFYREFLARRSSNDKKGVPSIVFVDELTPIIGNSTSGWDKEILGQLKTLSTESRKYRMYFVGGIQHPVAEYLPTVVSNMCSMRFVGKVATRKASEMALGVTEPDASRLVGGGDTIIYTDGNAQRFQVGYFSDQDTFAL